MPETETTVQINGGPKIPMSELEGAAARLRGPTVVADQLRLFIGRIERLLEEKKGFADDIRDVFAEAKANGYDTTTMREMIKLRKMEIHARQEREALIETYQLALGL